MTAPSFVAGTELDGNISSGGTVSWAAGGAADLIVIVYGCFQYTASPQTPSATGFSVFGQSNGTNSGQFQAGTGFLVKAAGTTSSGSATMFVSNAVAGQIDWISFRVQNADTTTMVEAANGKDGNSLTPNVDALTSGGIERLAIIALFANQAVTTAYSGFVNSAQWSGSSAEGAWFKTINAAGSTGAFSATTTGANSGWGNSFILIPPASTSPPADDVKARQGHVGPAPFGTGPRGPGPFRQTKSGLWYFPGSGANPVSTPQTLAVTQTQTPTLTASHASPRSLAVTQTQTAGLSATKQTPVYLTDEFPGSSIDLTKWDVYDRLGDQVNNEVNAVIPANVRVSGGSLLIDSKFETVTAGDTTTGAPNPRTVNYTSGQVAQHAPSFLYGSVQVRAKLPGGTGLWPCIWMLGYQWQASQPYTANVAGADWPNGGWWEIDIAEFMFDHRTVVNNALHFITANRTGTGEKALPFDATSRFMVYRLDWTATSLKWYVDAEDGVGWRNTTTMTGTPGVDIPNTPGYLIIHTAIGGNATNTPVSSTFPQTFEVDWARVTPAPGVLMAATQTQTPAATRRAGKPFVLTLTQTPTVTRAAAHPRALAATLTQTPTVAATRAFLRSLAATLTQTPTIGRGAARSLAATLTQTPTAVRATGHKVPTVTLTETPTVTRSAGKALVATLTQTPAAARSTGKAFVATLTQTPAIVTGRAFLRALAATLTQTPTSTRSTAKTAAVTQTQTASSSRSTGHKVSATLTQTPAAVRSIAHAVAATLTQTPTAAVSRAFLRTVAATLTQTVALARTAAHPRALTVTQTETPAVVRSTGKPVATTLTQTPVVVRSTGHKVTATQTQTPVLSASRAFLRTLVATITQTATAVRSAGKTATATQTQTPSSTRQTGKLVLVTQTQTPAIRRGLSATLSATITQTARLSRRTGKVLATVLGQVASLAASFSDKGSELPAASTTTGNLRTAESTGSIATARSTGRLQP